MEELRDFYVIRKHIIIFGAGFVGKFILNKLLMNNFKIDAFCDNASVRQGEKIRGVPVLSLNELRSRYGNEMLFIISVRDIDSIIMQLNDNGNYQWCSVMRAYDLEDISLELTFIEQQKLEAAWYAHKYFVDKKNLYMETLDLVITERCSLRCKECSNLMQYYKNPKDFSLQDIKLEVDSILEVVKEIYEVRIIGGEPFMCKEISEIISYLNDKEAIKRICIYTNATILPREDTIVSILKGGKTWFSISDYGNLSRNIDKLIVLLENRKIGFERKKIEYWTKCASFKKHNRSIDGLKKVYYECCAKKLVTLLKGKIFPCPFIANAMNLSAIPLRTADFVNLYEKGEIKERINSLLKKRLYYDSCDYCIGRPSVTFVQEKEKIKPHEQIAKPLPYEVVIDHEM